MLYISNIYNKYTCVCLMNGCYYYKIMNCTQAISKTACSMREETIGKFHVDTYLIISIQGENIEHL